MLSQRWRKNLVEVSRHSSRFAFAVAITLILTQFPFDYVESMLYDARVRLRPPPSPSGNIETIVIDDESVKALGRVPNALEFKKMIERLSKAGAHAIVSLVSPLDVVGSLDETRALAETAEHTPGFIVALDDVPLDGDQNALKLAPPFDKVTTASAPVPVDRNIFARDDVTRRMMLAYQGRPTLFPMLARDFNPTIARRFTANGGYIGTAFRGVFD